MTVCMTRNHTVRNHTVRRLLTTCNATAIAALGIRQVIFRAACVFSVCHVIIPTYLASDHPEHIHAITRIKTCMHARARADTSRPTQMQKGMTVHPQTQVGQRAAMHTNTYSAAQRGPRVTIELVSDTM